MKEKKEERKQISTKASPKLVPENKSQSRALQNLMSDKPYNFLIGEAGTGKTLMATVYAISKFLDGTYKKIVITRPAVSVDEELGFLPGPQPLDAKVLTPDGWVSMGDIKTGDMVIAWDGKPCEVKGVYPKGVKDVYRISTTCGRETEACLDHLWMTQTLEDRKRGREGSIKSTEEILNSLTIDKHVGSKEKRTVPNHYLPMSTAVQFSSSPLSLAPYTLGYLLGDGSLTKSIAFSIDPQDTFDIVPKIESEVSKIGCYVQKSTDVTYYINATESVTKKPRKVKITDSDGTESVFDSVSKASIAKNINKSTINSRCVRGNIVDGKKYEFIENGCRWSHPIKEILESIGVLNCKHLDKFIPEQYLFNSSTEDRMELLRGLMDSDGTVKGNGEASFCTTSLKLAEGIQELVRGLGGNCNLRSRNRVGKVSQYEGVDITARHPSYEFTVSMPEHMNPFFTERKASKHHCSYMYHPRIESVEFAGTKEVQCISIDHPDHLYITDDYIVTHNTIEQKMNPWMLPILDVFMEFFTAEDIESFMNEGLIEIAPLAYMRGRNLGPIDINETSDSRGFIVVADELQNSTPEQMKMLLTRLGKNSKMILTGDPTQHDRGMSENGLVDILKKLDLYKDSSISHISADVFDKKNVVRSPAVKEVLKLYPEKAKKDE